MAYSLPCESGVEDHRFKLIFEARLHMFYMVWITTSKDKIINIKNKDGEGLTHFLGVDSVIRMTPRKAII